MKSFNKCMSFILALVMLISALSVNVFAGEDVTNVEKATEVAQREDDDITETEIAEEPSTVTEKGMQFKIENLEDVKSIRYAYGEYETERDIKYGTDAVSHSGKTLRNKGNSCTLQFTKPGLVSIVVTYNDGTRDFYKYEVIKSEPTVTRDGGNSITFENLNDLKVLRYVKGEYESSYDIKRASGSVAISGKTLNSDTYTATLDRETYTFCVQYNDESYNYYVTGVCGDNLTWIYDMQNATLTISGEGEMYEYDYNTIPWVEYASNIKKVILESGITKISDYSFYENTSLESVELPSTLTEIGVCAFSACESLVNIELPSKLKEINNGTFSCCESLEHIVVPESVVFIGISAFDSCTNLKNVIMSNSLEIISSYAFQNCSKLENVIFGNNIKKIEDCAFYFCISLNNFDLPNSLQEICECAFAQTGYFNNKDNWKNGVLYNGSHLLDAKVSGTYILKNGTKTIAELAFFDSYMDILYIPESVKYIGNAGLYNINYKNTHFKVVEGSYAEQYAIEHNYPYSYFNPSDIYG